VNPEDLSLTPVEALFGFVAWLTTRNQVLSLGASCECGVAVDALKEFIDANQLGSCREGIYPDNLVMPKTDR
jgi:hypothetical protein